MIVIMITVIIILIMIIIIMVMIMMIQGQGPRPGPKQKAPPRAGPAAIFVWVPALVLGPYSACTRVLYMHKNLVRAQESCACTRIL